MKVLRRLTIILIPPAIATLPIEIVYYLVRWLAVGVPYPAEPVWWRLLNFSTKE